MRKIKVWLLSILTLLMTFTSSNIVIAQNYGTQISSGPLSNIKAVGDRVWYNQADVRKVLPSSSGHGISFQQFNNKAAYCTKFHVDRPAGTSATCVENLDNWGNNVKVQIGVAAIIRAADAVNNAMSKEYYYAELAINDFLYHYNLDENGNPRNSTNNVVGDGASDALREAVLGNYGYVEAAYRAIEDYENATINSIRIKSGQGKTQWDLNVDDRSSVSNTYVVSSTNMDKYSVRVTTSGRPSDNVKIKINGQDTNFQKTQSNGVNYLSNRLDNLTLENNSGTFTVSVEGLDVDENFKITVAVTGNVDYYVATNYECTKDSTKYQDMTLNEVEKKSEGRTKSTSFIVKTHDTNYPNLKIKKVDNSNNSVNGAEITLYEKVDNALDEIETFDDSDQNEYDYDQLSEGEYCIVETKAPSRYLLDKTSHCFVIARNGDDVTVTKSNNNDETINITDNLITITLQDNLNSLRIQKTDEQNNKMVAKLKLVRKDGNAFEINGQNVTEYIFTTSADNETVISGLSTGMYYVYEYEAPTGYIKSTDYKTFTITRTLTRPVSIVFPNRPISITISKVDIANGEELPGATLRILDENSNVVSLNGEKLQWVSTDKPHTISKLPAGTYYLEETQSPKGYQLMTEKIKFTIDESGNVAVNNESKDDSVVIMSNAVTKVSISKQDITTKEELPGAHLILKNANGELIEEWDSTSEPHLIEGLVPGEYILTEVTAPDGYSLNEESIKFTVNDDGSISGDTVMYNTPITNVPNTFSSQSLIITLFGSGIVGAGIGLYLYVCKKRQTI